MRLRVSSDAEADLEEIFLYWAERVSVPIADRLIDAIVERFRLLSEFPKAGKAPEEIIKGIRCFPAGNYLIYYRTQREFTDILHVFHGARDQKLAFQRRRK